MAGRRKHQGINWLVTEYRRVVRDKKSTIGQRLKALDRLAVIDEVFNITLTEATEKSPQPEPDFEVDAENSVQKALSEIREIRRKKGENDGISSGHKGRDKEIRPEVG